jgi:hypothetical protein
MYFLAFLDIVPSDLDALFALLVPPPEGGGEVLFAQGSDDPLPGVLEAVLGEREASHLHLEFGEQSIGAKSDEQGMFNHLDLSGLHPILFHGGGVDWGIVPIEK